MVDRYWLRGEKFCGQWVERFLMQCSYAVSLDASSRTSASESLEWRTVNFPYSLDIPPYFK